MGKYSINELERLSGIKAHTLRIWEKRYKLMIPSRTTTNIRFYSDSDLKKIMNVRMLNECGVKISHIATLNPDELHAKVLELVDRGGEFEVYVSQLVICMINMNEEDFNVLMAKLALKYGLERTLTQVIYPFLDRIGILWQTSNISPAQEHFISNLIRQKVIVAIDSLPGPPKDAVRVVLFLPEGELHEISLLFAFYLVKKSGYRACYLGQSVPYSDLTSVINTLQPSFLITMMLTERRPSDIQHFINTLSADFREVTILASGAAIIDKALQFPPNFHILQNVEEVRRFLPG
jgi:DNA-binding transcriptional MerR regulator